MYTMYTNTSSNTPSYTYGSSYLGGCTHDQNQEPRACMILYLVPLIYKISPLIKLVCVKYIARKSPQIHTQVKNK